MLSCLACLSLTGCNCHFMSPCAQGLWGRRSRGRTVNVLYTEPHPLSKEAMPTPLVVIPLPKTTHSHSCSTSTHHHPVHSISSYSVAVFVPCRLARHALIYGAERVYRVCQSDKNYHPSFHLLARRRQRHSRQRSTETLPPTYTTQ